MIFHGGVNDATGTNSMTSIPDIQKATRLTPELLAEAKSTELCSLLSDARKYLQYYNWCHEISEEFIGIFEAGIIGLFLFRIIPGRPEVDEWIWVIVGDLPPTYLTCDGCPNPATALDAYIGAMQEWVEAASAGQSVAELIPVDMPATPTNAELLRERLSFLDARILSQFRQDLI
jgi:hypothetical protein